MERQGYSEAQMEQVLQERGLTNVQPNQQLIQGIQAQGQQQVQSQVQDSSQNQQQQQQMSQNQGEGFTNQGIIETPDDNDYYAAEVRRRESQAARNDMEKQGYSEAQIEQVLQERGLTNVQPNQQLVQGFETQGQQPVQSQVQEQLPTYHQQQQVPQNQDGGFQNQGIIETPDDDDYYAAEVRRREAQAFRNDMENQGYSEAQIEQVLQERGLTNVHPNQQLAQGFQTQDQQPVQSPQQQQQVPQNQDGGFQNQGTIETPDGDDYYAAEVRRREAQADRSENKGIIETSDDEDYYAAEVRRREAQADRSDNTSRSQRLSTNSQAQEQLPTHHQQQQVPQTHDGGFQNQGINETPDDDDYYAAEVRRREAQADRSDNNASRSQRLSDQTGIESSSQSSSMAQEEKVDPYEAEMQKLRGQSTQTENGPDKQECNNSQSQGSSTESEEDRLARLMAEARAAHENRAKEEEQTLAEDTRKREEEAVAKKLEEEENTRRQAEIVRQKELAEEESKKREAEVASQLRLAEEESKTRAAEAAIQHTLAEENKKRMEETASERTQHTLAEENKKLEEAASKRLATFANQASLSEGTTYNSEDGMKFFNQFLCDANAKLEDSLALTEEEMIVTLQNILTYPVIKQGKVLCYWLKIKNPSFPYNAIQSTKATVPAVASIPAFSSSVSASPSIEDDSTTTFEKTIFTGFGHSTKEMGGSDNISSNKIHGNDSLFTSSVAAAPAAASAPAATDEAITTTAAPIFSGFGHATGHATREMGGREKNSDIDSLFTGSVPALPSASAPGTKEATTKAAPIFSGFGHATTPMGANNNLSATLTAAASWQ